MKFSPTQFDRTRHLALRLAGIDLIDRHRELLPRRCRRLGILDGAGLDALLNAAESGDASATAKLVGLVTTKHTGFFRDPGQIQVAAAHALRTAHPGSRSRLWSAAAATGEEPYSLAMALIESTGDDAPPVSILATDIDVEALSAARHGEYAERTLRALEPERRARFFVQAGADRWRIVPAVRRLIEFREINVAAVEWPVEGPFEVIFCRNVLMYLETCHRYAVLERMASMLAPDGLLFLDPAEHLGKAAHLFSPGAGRACYRRRALSLKPAATNRLP